MVQMWRAGKAAALATVVRVDGSSYRRPGARLMLGMDGEQVGSISGGCLEADVVRKLRWLTTRGACIQSYSTTFDDFAELPYGLGCGGDITLLLEPAYTPAFEASMLAMESSLAGRDLWVRSRLPRDQRPLTRTVQARLHAKEQHCDQDYFCEHLGAPPRLLIFGAGNDAQPLVGLLAFLGWRVIVIDRRSQWARSERFPTAEAVIAAKKFAIPQFEVKSDDAAVIMTHSYEQDRGWLGLLLPTEIRYIGLLGAKHRGAQLAQDVANVVGWPDEDVHERLFTPVGLDLGGDGPEAIALSIVAQIQSFLSGREPVSRQLSRSDLSTPG